MSCRPFCLFPLVFTLFVKQGVAAPDEYARRLDDDALARMFHKLPLRVPLADAVPHRQRLQCCEQRLPYPIKRDINEAAWG